MNQKVKSLRVLKIGLSVCGQLKVKWLVVLQQKFVKELEVELELYHEELFRGAYSAEQGES